MQIKKNQDGFEGPGRDRDYRAWIAVTIVILVVAVIRFKLIEVPFERDEGEYAYAGQLILKGIAPYKYAYNMKFPGIYAAYALILAIFGETHGGVHFGLLLMNGATAILLFLLGRRLFDSFTGAAAGAGFAVLSVSQSVQGLQANAEHFVIFFCVAGLLLLLRALDSGRRRTLFLGGLLMGGAVLMKQHGAAFALFSVLYLGAVSAIERRDRLPAVAAKLAIFSAGVVLPFGATCVILYSAGVFATFWFWTFDYARVYAKPIPLLWGFLYFKENASDILASSWPLWALGALGVTAMAWYKPARRRVLFLAGFLVFSILAILPGLYFRPHYFVLTLPAAAIFFGVGAASISGLFKRLENAAIKTSVATALVGFALVYPAYLQRDVLFFSSPTEVSRITYTANPFPEALEIARYIKEHSSEDDRIAIMGSEPEIYFYSDRLSATGYIYTYALMESHGYARKMQEEMIREVEAARPLYLVFVKIPTSWLVRPGSEMLIFKWFDRYRSRYYDLDGVVDILSMEETRYVWGEDAKGYRPLSNIGITVYKRRGAG